MRKILFDLRIINNYKTGISRYLSLIRRFISNNQKEKIYLLFNNKYTNISEFNNIDNVEILLSPYRSFSIKELLLIGNIVNKLDVDIYHSLNMFLPLFLNKKIKKVVIIHDIITLRFSAVARFYVRVYDYFMLKYCVKKADKIMVDSAFTLKDVCEYLKCSLEKFSVISPAINSDYKIIYDNELLNSITDKYKLPDKFVFYLGSNKPNKNIEIIIESLNKIRDINVNLVLAGKQDKRYKTVSDLIDQYYLTDKIRIIDYVDEEDLPCLYNLADIFIWPSKYEGFGIPILEAMACGTPVIVSNSTCHPEVAGNAGLYFEPDDSEELAGQIIKLYKDKKLYDELVEKGLRQNNSFNWEKSLEVLTRIYSEI